VLALGAELFVRGASELARKPGISSFFNGLGILGLASLLRAKSTPNPTES